MHLGLVGLHNICGFLDSSSLGCLLLGCLYIVDKHRFQNCIHCLLGLNVPSYRGQYRIATLLAQIKATSGDR